MADRTTKALLLAIAAGLWMNVVSQWLPVHAQDQEVRDRVNQIADDVNSLERIARGACSNNKIC